MNTRKIGFYLHTSWEYEYPFAVRSWTQADFAGMFSLMQQLGFNLVMFWPLTEVMPAPLSPEDVKELETMRGLADEAHARGLKLWLTFTANSTSRPEIAAKPFKARHFYPFRIDVNLEDEEAREDYFTHRAAVLKILNNADAYVTIDGDPGSYPNAQPRDFVEVFKRDKKTLDSLGRADAQLVPWIWAGWGHDWEKNGVWNEPLEPLTAPVLDALKSELPQPWTLLPGRSIRDDWANGRSNFTLAENAGLIENSVLLLYEIIEYEPTPPAVCLQFNDIRRVFQQEAPLLQKARGIMGNAQQPIMALPNFYFFARAAQNAEYLNKGDEEILTDLADFLGGDAKVLIPAWRCGVLPLGEIPADLPQQLRALNLGSPSAQNLPGGAQKYAAILADWVEARLEVLRACEMPHDSTALIRGLRALANWWKVHRYVFSGEQGTDFRLDYTHWILLSPLQNWCANFSGDREETRRATIENLCDGNFLSRVAAENAVNQLLF